ncbi:MAG: hypothetical protein M3Y42_02015 [Actinomycetota bacterium]|nr:hypothetical protein [Actinomycetota bacterium]MDQ2955722.1 hypothetical protein [Actinomycetota bacterium]
MIGVLLCIFSASVLAGPANATARPANATARSANATAGSASATASPASAPSSCLYSVELTPQSAGVVKLSCGGHTYYCYQGDLCMWRGSFQTYYKCATYTNTYTGPGGWIVNNETGGAKAILYPTAYYASQGVTNAAVPHWSGNSSTGYSYTVLNWFIYGKFKVC